MPINVFELDISHASFIVSLQSHMSYHCICDPLCPRSGWRHFWTKHAMWSRDPRAFWSPILNGVSKVLRNFTFSSSHIFCDHFSCVSSRLQTFVERGKRCFLRRQDKKAQARIVCSQADFSFHHNNFPLQAKLPCELLYLVHICLLIHHTVLVVHVHLPVPGYRSFVRRKAILLSFLFPEPSKILKKLPPNLLVLYFLKTLPFYELAHEL